ncbi:MAG TPA: DUF4433 domain-containing protein [Stellaceae bacterium]|nr:DUF4433 domain-containing protein [Stellaceae bacterium]
MTGHHYPSLNAQRALVWRIVHRDNVPWLLDNGMHSANSTTRSLNWVTIGNLELIDKRASHVVPIQPGGVLNDYVPFYFTPFSVMLYNILTGRGVRQRKKEEIVILVSSIPRIQQERLMYIFTDAHAYYGWANYYSDPADLVRIDWAILQSRDFKRDADDPKKFERYQAEALIHSRLPISALLGIVCYTDEVKNGIEAETTSRGLSLPIYVRRGWYF